MNQLPTIINQDDEDEEGYTAGSYSQHNRMLRIFGSIQIALGVVAAILSFVGLILDGINISIDCAYLYCTGYVMYYYRCVKHEDAPTMFVLDSICLIFSGWSILTGAFPFCMTGKRKNRWRCFKISFMVCSIVAASVFAPTAFGVGVVAALIRARDTGAKAVIPSFVALISFAELVVAIIASSYCCCCSDWNMYERVRTVDVTKTPLEIVTSMPDSQISNQRQFPNTMTQIQLGRYTTERNEEQNRFETSRAKRVNPPPAYTNRIC